MKTSARFHLVGNPVTLTLSLVASLVIGSTHAAETQGDKKDDNKPRVEVCFVLDTTGSMGGLIQGAKDKIWSIANMLATAKPTPNIKFGLVAYRDRGDQYITQVFDLNEDIDAIYEHLMAFKAGGGNDTPESVNQGLHEAVTKMSWTKKTRTMQLVFLVGDAPPHMDYADDVKYPEVCKMAVKKNLIINTIQCGNMAATTKIWKDIARLSEGEYAAIQQNGGTTVITTPYDKEITEVNRQINTTIVGYGNAAKQRMVQSKIATNAASNLEVVADRADYFRNSVGAGKVLGGNDDLVEQVLQNKIQLKDVDAKKLPENLKKLSAEKQRVAIETCVANRKKWQAKMTDLLKKRAEFLKEEKKRQAKAGKDDGFDRKVKKIIATQSKSNGLSLED